jgi:hypothetical protein
MFTEKGRHFLSSASLTMFKLPEGLAPQSLCLPELTPPEFSDTPAFYQHLIGSTPPPIQCERMAEELQYNALLA